MTKNNHFNPDAFAEVGSGKAEPKAEEAPAEEAPAEAPAKEQGGGRKRRRRKSRKKGRKSKKSRKTRKTRKARKTRKKGKKKRGLNPFFKLMLSAKKAGKASFKYLGKTYKGRKHPRLGMIYKKA